MALTEKQIHNRLEKEYKSWLKKNPTVNEDEVLWHTNPNDYTWKFEAIGKTFRWELDPETKKINKEIF